MSLQEGSAIRQDNPMLAPRIEKVVVNISVGKSGEPLERAMKILQELTGQKPCMRRAKKTIRDFGIRKKEPTACIVTLRGPRAQDFLKKAFEAVDNRLPAASFDRCGNFSFGIKEHISIAGTKYSPDLGIIGMDVAVILGRAGQRVKQRHRAKSSIGSSHVLNRDEAISFVKSTLGAEVV